MIGSAIGLLLAAIFALSPLDAAAQGEPINRRESVEIEPYEGPPIYLPAGEAPPPPTEVESRTIKENFPETETLRFERRVVRYSDNSVVSDGPSKEYYSNGQLYVEGEYDQGKPVGKWEYHHPNGEVAKEVTYVDGKPDGEVKVYNEQGKLTSQREYNKGVRSGVWKSYNEEGDQLLAEERYVDGKASGVFKVWYKNGQLRQELTFVEGKREGPAKEWTLVGDKRAEVNFKNGVKHGPAKLWQRDGTVVEQTYEEGRLVKDK